MTADLYAARDEREAANARAKAIADRGPVGDAVCAEISAVVVTTRATTTTTN
jgi:hypothetical protein